MNSTMFLFCYRKLLVCSKWLLTVVMLSSVHLSLNAQKNFYWKWAVRNDSLEISGKLEGHPPDFLKLPLAPIRENFACIYRTIDLINYKQAKTFTKIAGALSQQLVNPFATKIRSCQLIVVSIDSALLGFPLEFLTCGNKPIALVRPMVFQISGRLQKEGSEMIVLKKGLIIRDPTADPEDACATTFSRYPASTYKSAYHLSMATLTTKKDQDFLLISTHGYIDSATYKGRVLLKDSILDPAFFYQNRFKLVYLDACQQGMNWAYLSSLSKALETTFYLGPIVSNDSGESSTKTINWFFSEMKKSNNPVLAIWKARNLLYQHYSKKINQLDVINKALIFRIYRV